MAGSPKKRAARAAAAAAAAAAGPAPALTPGAPQELIDARAAEAIVEAPWTGDKHRLNAVFPEASALDREQRRTLSEATFKNERVQNILANDIMRIDRHRADMFDHMVEIARDRKQPDLAIRAFTQLAKIAGWAAPVKIDMTGKVFNIHSLLQDPAAISDALAMMSHEPGEAVAIQSDARDDWEKRHAADTLDAE